jgi:hypothetical protein
VDHSCSLYLIDIIDLEEVKHQEKMERSNYCGKILLRQPQKIKEVIWQTLKCTHIVDEHIKG